MYSQTFDPTTGALGSSSAFLLLQGSRAFKRGGRHAIRWDPSPVCRRVPKLQSCHPGLSRQRDADRGHDVRPRQCNAPMTLQSRAVTDPNDGQTDYTVLAYTDNNQVHLELLNNYGDQIGSDFVVPGVTSFDRLHSILWLEQ